MKLMVMGTHSFSVLSSATNSYIVKSKLNSADVPVSLKVLSQ